MGTAEDFTGGRITRRISRATESMSQSVVLIIFILIPTVRFAVRNVAPQFLALQMIYRVCDVPEFQAWHELEIWNWQNGTTRSRSLTRTYLGRSLPHTHAWIAQWKSFLVVRDVEL
jgi:hypothetical protein